VGHDEHGETQRDQDREHQGSRECRSRHDCDGRIRQVTERYFLTAPTLVGKTRYIRDLKRILAIDLG
jgi:hypothetical protein